jgi:hypothetical protein
MHSSCNNPYKLPVFNSDHPTSIVRASITFSIQKFVATENRCTGISSMLVAL